MIERDCFKNSMQYLAGSVAVVTTAFDGIRSGFTATAVMSVSDLPPSVAVCVNKNNFTHDILLKANMFCINVLNREQAAIADIFSGRANADRNMRFCSGRWSVGPKGMPILTDCVAAFECSLQRAVDVFTHTLSIGIIDYVHTDDRIGPLVYWRRGFSEVSPLETAQVASVSR